MVTIYSTDQEIIAKAFQEELMKIADAKKNLSATTVKTLGLVGAGALGYRTVSQANQDRKLGRSMRMQQQGY